MTLIFPPHTIPSFSASSVFILTSIISGLPIKCLVAKPSDEQRILCTIIRKSGSAPRNAGTQMIVTSDNRIIGTIGGGCAEAEIITRCRDIFNGFAMPMQETASKNDGNKNRAVCQKDDFASSSIILSSTEPLL